MPIYICEKCGWKSINKTHFKQHLLRKFSCNPNSKISNKTLLRKFFPEIYQYKEEPNENNDQNNLISDLQCNFCLKKFQHKQSKWRHIKVCSLKPESENIDDIKSESSNEIEEELENATDKEKIKLLIEKLNEEKKRVEDKDKQLSHYAEIITKIAHKPNINTTNNTTNNTTLNTTINFQMNAFGSENISYISKSFLTQLLKIPYSSIPKLLEYIHFNKNYPENQNVKIINRKEKWAQKHNGTEWEFVPKNSLINEMISNGVNILEVHYEENGGKEELNEVKQERWEKFSGEIREEKPATVKRLIDDTECLLLNKLAKSKELTDENKPELNQELDDFESLEEADIQIQKNLETINNID
jgi:hypothetical protein